MYADVSTGPRQPGSSAPTKPPRQQEPTTYADINFRKSGNDDMLWALTENLSCRQPAYSKSTELDPRLRFLGQSSYYLITCSNLRW